MKHTPGPWEMGSQNPSDNTISIKQGKSTLGYLSPRPHWDDTQEANARLIAAAPELLEALKRALEIMDTEPGCNIYKAHKDTFKQAINKAEGN